MKLLEDRILKDGQVLPGQILKVDSFLNHQVDIALLDELGKEFARLFSGLQINKILTIEASGIGIACIAARHFGNVPVVFAKKTKGLNQDPDSYSAKVWSYTRGTSYDVIVSRRFLGPGDRVLIIDDFLANGHASEGLIEILGKAGAKLEGVGIVIEKGFQEGGKRLRKKGVNLQSLAIVDSMTDEDLVFRKGNQA